LVQVGLKLLIGFKKKVEAINPDIDLNSFVAQNKPENAQPPPRAQYMSWDGTLIEDLGPRKDNQQLKKNNVPTTTANVTNSQPQENKPELRFLQNIQKDQQQQAVQQVVQQPPDLVAQNTVSNFTPIKTLIAIYAYDATETGELTFGEGETIALLEENDSGWWRGRLTNGSEGLFPSNFVEEQGKAASAVPSNGVNEINATFKALYDYDAEDNTELSIKENELLFVETEKDGWYYGYNKSNANQKGNFPSNFVEKVVD